MPAQLARQVTELLCQPRARVVRVLALGPKLVGHAIDAVRLPGGSLADLLLLGDDGVLRVRDKDHRREDEHRHETDRCRSTRQAWPEQRRRDGPQGG